MAREGKTYFGIAVCQMPNIPLDSETTWTIAHLRNIPTYSLGESVILEIPDAFRRESSPDEEEESGGANKEPV